MQVFELLRHSKILERVDEVLKQNRKLKVALLTFTVKNGHDLHERSSHLITSLRTLIKRRQDYKKKARGFNEFCKIDGAMYSYENTYNEQTGEWHPHVHMLVLLNDWIDQEQLSETWHEITLDSFVVDVRRVKKSKEFGYAKAAAEVCKYALKFGDLTVEKTWEAFKILKGKRLSGAFGSLYGVKIPENLADEMPDDQDLPYLEMLYKFVFGKHSYYDLVMTRQVEPQANIERMSEEEDTTDRHDMREIERVAKNEERNGAEVRGNEYSPPRNAPQYKRKKQYWKVPPVTRVRVRQRIRKWDGYLYNIDLFPYIEHRLLAFIEG